MVVVETIARIRREHLGKGIPIKQISRELRLSRNTVRKVVRSDEMSFRYERKIQPMPKLGAWVEELERCLEANGVCQRGIYDNMKTAVNAVFIGKEREYNERFVQMCSHHLVEPVACTPGAGWEKGQVENQVGTARGRLTEV